MARGVDPGAPEPPDEHAQAGGRGTPPPPPAEILSQAFMLSPWDVYGELRRHHPVHWSPAEGIFFVVKHSDVRSVLTSEPLSPEPPARFADDVLGTTLRSLTGDEHARLRSAFTTMLWRSEVDRLAPQRLDPLLDEVIAGVGEHGGADFVSQVAEPLALRAAARTIGIPERDAAWVFTRVRTLMEGQGGSTDAAQPAAARDEVFGYLRDLLRAPAPADTVIEPVSGMVAARMLDRDEAVRNVILLFAAATKPMAAGLANVLLCLARHPDAYHSARADPDQVPAIVSESLRWETPLDLVCRFARADTTIAGRGIPRGSPVLVALASANRDEDAFLDAHRWNPRRPERGHLAFGAGPHACMGRYLATYLMEGAVRRCLARWRELSPARSQAPPVAGPFVRMPVSLHLHGEPS